MNTATLDFLNVDERTALMCGVFAAHLKTQNRHAEAARWEQIWVEAGRPSDPAQQTEAQQALDRLLRLGAQYGVRAGTAPAGSYAAAHQLPPVRLSTNPPPVAPTAKADALALAAERLREAPHTINWIRRMTRRETLPPIRIAPALWSARRAQQRAWLRRLIVFGRAVWMLTLDALIQVQITVELQRTADAADHARQLSADLAGTLNQLGKTVLWATGRLDRFEAAASQCARRPPR